MTAARVILGSILLIFAVAIGASSPIDYSHAPTVAACTEEDGSAPGQEFPCRWDGGSNGVGTSTLQRPICTDEQIRIHTAAALRGRAEPLACDY